MMLHEEKKINIARYFDPKKSAPKNERNSESNE